jgi:hypothetical protein
MKARRDPWAFLEGGGTVPRDQGAIRAGRAFGYYGKVREEGRQMRHGPPQCRWNPQALRHDTARASALMRQNPVEQGRSMPQR